MHPRAGVAPRPAEVVPLLDLEGPRELACAARTAQTLSPARGGGEESSTQDAP